MILRADTLAKKGFKVTQRSVTRKLEKLLKQYKKEAVEINESQIDMRRSSEILKQDYWR